MLAELIFKNYKLPELIQRITKLKQYFAELISKSYELAKLIRKLAKLTCWTVGGVL